ncbi:MAG: hypothetical protein LUD07_10930 [Clostridiales bacterium]|nr:hypothetical protein [Clostridiales bacterium]
MENYGFRKKLAGLMSGILLTVSVLGMTSFASVPDFWINFLMKVPLNCLHRRNQDQASSTRGDMR